MADMHLGVLLRHVRRFWGPRQPRLPDGQLLDRFARQGDETAFAALVERHGPMVLGVCRRVLHHEQDAEDVFQATFLILARKAGSIRQRTAVGSWLYGVAHRLALKARANAVRRAVQERRSIAASGSPRTDSADPAADLAWGELRSILDEELARLPDRLRAPLLLCYLEGLTQDEAARQLGWKKRTVKARLARGRDLLRRRLIRRGLTLSAALSGPLLAPTPSPAAVPPRLTEAAVHAAVLCATGQNVAAVVSSSVMLLAEGGLAAMFLTKLSLVTVVLLAVGILASGAGLLLNPGTPPTKTPTPLVKEAPPADRHGDPLPAGAVARLGTERFRHGGQGLQGLAFLPDGRTLVGAAANGGHAIWFWEADTGRLRRTMRTEPLSIRGFTLAPDGRRIAIGGFLPVEGDQPIRGAIHVLDVASGKVVWVFARSDVDTDHCSLALTPDGKFLISLGDRSGILRIEEIATGVEILRQQFPGDILSNLVLSPDGTSLAVSTGPNTRKVYLWKWQTGEKPRSIRVRENGHRFLAFSPDGKVLAGADDSNQDIRLWDVASSRVRMEIRISESDGSPRGHLAFSPDGKILACTGHHRDQTGVILLWDPRTGRSLGRLETGAAGPELLTFSPDSRRIATATISGARVWDLASGKELAAEDEAHLASIESLAVSVHDLVATASGDHTVRLWDLATGRQRQKLQHGSRVQAIALSPDGTKLASSSLDDTVRLWDAQTGREIYRLAGHGKTGGRRSLGFTPDSSRLLSWGDDSYLRIWDVGNGKALAEYALRPSGVKFPGEDGDGNGIERMNLLLGASAFSPDGRMFVMSVSTHFYAFAVDTGRELAKFPTGMRSVSSLTISPDSKTMLANGWGAAIQTKLPDGRMRFSTAPNHPVYLCELPTGKLLKSLELPGSIGGPVAFSAAGKLFAEASGESNLAIRICAMPDGKEVRSFQGFRSNVRSLAFAPDGEQLISGMLDSTALVWNLTKQP
jgi:RNA polymerase sigma factor (sigma-70 family)